MSPSLGTPTKVAEMNAFELELDAGSSLRSVPKRTGLRTSVG